MLPQKAFKKSNLHSMICRFNEKEILCTQKYTISPNFGMIGVTKVKKWYSYNQVRCQRKTSVVCNKVEISNVKPNGRIIISNNL